MSNHLADPLFVRAEVDYRLENWGVAPFGSHPGPGRRTPRRWRRRLDRWRRPTTHRRPVAVARPRHP